MEKRNATLSKKTKVNYSFAFLGFQDFFFFFFLGFYFYHKKYSDFHKEQDSTFVKISSKT